MADNYDDNFDDDFDDNFDDFAEKQTKFSEITLEWGRCACLTISGLIFCLRTSKKWNNFIYSHIKTFGTKFEGEEKICCLYFQKLVSR